MTKFSGMVIAVPCAVLFFGWSVWGAGTAGFTSAVDISSSPRTSGTPVAFFPPGNTGKTIADDDESRLDSVNAGLPGNIPPVPGATTEDRNESGPTDNSRDIRLASKVSLAIRNAPAIGNPVTRGDRWEVKAKQGNAHFAMQVHQRILRSYRYPSLPAVPSALQSRKVVSSFKAGDGKEPVVRYVNDHYLLPDIDIRKEWKGFQKPFFRTRRLGPAWGPPEDTVGMELKWSGTMTGWRTNGALASDAVRSFQADVYLTITLLAKPQRSLSYVGTKVGEWILDAKNFKTETGAVISSPSSIQTDFDANGNLFKSGRARFSLTGEGLKTGGEFLGADHAFVRGWVAEKGGHGGAGFVAARKVTSP